MADTDTIALPRLSAADLPMQAGRHDRPAMIAFVEDAASETALREGLADVAHAELDIRRGGIKAAIHALRKAATPRVLVIDISGVDQPLSALHELSFVTEPDVQVLVIGDLNSLDFYREVTRGLGALEYLIKPVTRDMIHRHFAPLIIGGTPVLDSGQGGRVISITGARGGVGATTLAVNLAYHFGVTADRHTVLLDPDLHLGTAAMLLDCPAGPGLRMALEDPQRIDELFVERSAQPVAERLHVLAGEVRLSEQPEYMPDAASTLLAALCRRYNFVVCDVPFAPHPLYRDLLDCAHQRVLVMEPTLVCVRDTLRLLSLPPAGGAQGRRPLIVLNRVGLRGSLTRRKVEEALKTKVDVVIPDMPRAVEAAATIGEAVTAGHNAFRRGVVELARLTASVRLLDGARSEAGVEPPPEGRRRWRLFSRN
jgi:pilus assembly protein CpaE